MHLAFRPLLILFDKIINALIVCGVIIGTLCTAILVVLIIYLQQVKIDVTLPPLFSVRKLGRVPHHRRRLDQLSFWLVLHLRLHSCLVSLRLCLVLEPLRTKFIRDCVLFRILERVDLLQGWEHIALDDGSCEPFVGLLRLSDLLLKMTIAHVCIVRLEKGPLLLAQIIIKLHAIEVENLPPNRCNVELFEDFS